MMKSSTFLGSTLGVLLAFSVISYARITQKQEPKPATIQQPAAPDVAGQEPELREAATSVPSTNSNAAPLPVNASSLAPPNSKAEASEFIVGPQTYSATAYSLRGRTASGRASPRRPTSGSSASDPAAATMSPTLTTMLADALGRDGMPRRLAFRRFPE